MSLPEFVQVASTRYRIVGDDEAYRHCEGGSECVGRCLSEKQIIAVTPNQGPDSKADSLLHEVLHAVWIATGGKCDDDHEAVVARFTPVLLDTLRRNPELVRALTSEGP